MNNNSNDNLILESQKNVDIESYSNNVNITAVNCVNLNTDSKSINLTATTGQINLIGNKTMTLVSKTGDIELNSVNNEINTTSFNDTNLTSLQGNVNINSNNGTINISSFKNINITPGTNQLVNIAGTLNASQIFQGLPDEIVNNPVTLNNTNAFLLVPTGCVMPYAGSTNPNGWLLCDGASYNIYDRQALFLVVGYTFGGSGNSFNVPDLRGRIPVGYSNGISNITNKNIGDTGGEETHILSVNEMPSHAHDFSTYNNTGNHGINLAGSHGVVTDYNSTNTTGYTGGSLPHNNMQPYIALNYIIKY